MSNVATVVGSAFAVTSGEAVAACPKTSQPKSKGGRQAFADAAPLARLREEIRSNDTRAQRADPQEPMGQAKVAECEADPVESLVGNGRPQPQSHNGATEPAEEETAPLEAASAASEAAVEIEIGAALPPSQSGEAEAADPSTSARAEVAGESVVEVTTDVSLVSERQSLNVAVRAASGDGQVFNQVRASAATETAAGKQHSLQSEVTVSVDKDNVDVSGKILVQESAAGRLSDNAGASPALTAGAEAAKAVVADAATPAAKEQAGEPVDTQAKVAVQSGEAADTTKAATVEAAAKPQGQVRSEVQVPAEGSKDPGFDKATVASRGSQTPQRSSDDMPREEGQNLSQQDHKAVSQGPVQAIAAPEQDKGASGPGSRELSQPQAELATVPESDSTGAAGRLSAQAPGSAGLDGTPMKSPVQDIGEQILSSVHASVARADRQVQIRLDPPELGSVLVRITEQGDQIRGVLEVGRDETRREIERALPQVLRGLQDAGVPVRRLEVVVSDQPDKGLGKEQSQQDTWTQQQHQDSDRQGYRPQNASAMNWSAQTGFQQSRAGRQGPDGVQTQGAQDRIDMLV